MCVCVFVIEDGAVVTAASLSLNSWLRLWSVDPMNFMRPASLLWPLKYHVCLFPERIYFADSLRCACVRAERIRFSSYLFASFFLCVWTGASLKRKTSPPAEVSCEMRLETALCNLWAFSLNLGWAAQYLKEMFQHEQKIHLKIIIAFKPTSLLGRS